MTSLTHHLRIIGTYLRIGLLNFVQYRTDALMALVGAVIQVAAQLIGLAIIFSHTSALDGWSYPSLIALTGVFFLTDGLLAMVLRPSLQTLLENIRLGTLDFTLVKPADAQVLAAVQTVRPQAISDIAIGVVALGWSLSQSDSAVTPVQALAFVVTLLCGIATVSAFLFLLATAAFWFVKLDNIFVIFDSLFGQAARWPVTIFPGWLRVIMTFVIPVSFAVTVPVQGLTGSLGWPTAVLAVVVSAAFVTASRLFWRFALKHYTGASA